MNSETDVNNDQSADRTVLPVEVTPRPTYAPVALAVATAMLFWGILTHWVMSLVGGCILIWSLGSWMNEIRNEWERS